jgi:hypothetical protein
MAEWAEIQRILGLTCSTKCDGYGDTTVLFDLCLDNFQKFTPMQASFSCLLCHKAHVAHVAADHRRMLTTELVI